MLLNGAAARFVDELETRDNVTAAIFEHCAPFGGQEGGHVSAWLLMTQAVVDAYSPASFAFYQFKVCTTMRVKLVAQLRGSCYQHHVNNVVEPPNYPHRVW